MTMKLKQLLSEGNLITNFSDPNFDGGDPDKIEHRVGDLGQVITLQQTRNKITELLKKMTKESESATRSHKYSHMAMGQIKSDMKLLHHYMDAHQRVIEELEDIRKKGGSNSKKVPVKFEMG